MAEESGLRRGSETRTQVVLDTTVLVAAFVQDAHHAVAMRIVGELAGGKLQAFCSALALAEFAGVMSRNAGEHTARIALDEIRTLREAGLLRVIAVDRNLADAACDIAVKARIHGADAIMVATAQLIEGALATFDAQLRQRAHGYVSFIPGS